MADVVNRGSFPNDESADTLYVAFGKINVKFDNIDLVLPTSDQKAAMAGISDPPSGANKFVTEADLANLDSSLWELDGATHVKPKNDLVVGASIIDGLGAAALLGVGTGSNQVAAGDHGHDTLPSAGEKAALAGTEGTPSASNKYITEENTKVFSAEDLPLNADQIRKITAGTADPTGGSNGDIYLQYEDD